MKSRPPRWQRLRGAHRGLGPSHSLHPRCRIRSHPQRHQRCCELGCSLGHSRHSLARQPCSQLTRSCLLLGNSSFSCPSEQRKQPFSLPAGRFAAAAPAKGSPLLLFLGKPASLPGTTLVLLTCTLQTLGGHLSVSPVRTDSQPQDERLALCQGVSPAMLSSCQSAAEDLKTRD